MDNEDEGLFEADRLRQQRVGCEFGVTCAACYGFGVCENETDEEREQVYAQYESDRARMELRKKELGVSH